MNLEPGIEVRELGIVMAGKSLLVIDESEEGLVACDVRYFYAHMTETHGMWFQSYVDAAFPPELIEREHARRLESFRERVRKAVATGGCP